MEICDAPRFVPAADARGWSQLNIGLAGASGSLRDAAWPLFDQLERWLDATRSRGLADAWFVRKSPALRLRLGGPGLDARARQGVEDLLRRGQGRGVVTTWGWATYEPEVSRLGGPVVLELVHALLSRSTDVWLAWERLSRRGAARLGPDLMALSLYGDLLDQSLRANEEVWDVWLALLRIYDRPGTPATARADHEPRWLRPGSLDRLASLPERALLQRGREAAADFAAGLGRAHDECTLVGGRRALLATLASFLFNLWCLHARTIAQLCRAATHQLRPRFELPTRPQEMSAR